MNEKKFTIWKCIDFNFSSFLFSHLCLFEFYICLNFNVENISVTFFYLFSTTSSKLTIDIFIIMCLSNHYHMYIMFIRSISYVPSIPSMCCAADEVFWFQTLGFCFSFCCCCCCCWNLLPSLLQKMYLFNHENPIIPNYFRILLSNELNETKKKRINCAPNIHIFLFTTARQWVKPRNKQILIRYKYLHLRFERVCMCAEYRIKLA